VEVTDVRGTAGGARVLRTDPEVDYAEPDARMYPLSDPDDPFYPLQSEMWEEPGGLRLPTAWPVSRGAGTVAAVAHNANGITQTFWPGTAVLRDQMAAFSCTGTQPGREGRRITLDPRGITDAVPALSGECVVGK
jgi:serine protease